MGLSHNPQVRVARHPNIGDQHVEPMIPESLDGFLGVFSTTAIEALALERASCGLAETHPRRQQAGLCRGDISRLPIYGCFDRRHTYKHVIERPGPALWALPLLELESRVDA